MRGGGPGGTGPQPTARDGMPQMTGDLDRGEQGEAPPQQPGVRQRGAGPRPHDAPEEQHVHVQPAVPHRTDGRRPARRSMALHRASRPRGLWQVSR